MVSAGDLLHDLMLMECLLGACLTWKVIRVRTCLFRVAEGDELLVDDLQVTHVV